MDFFTLLIVLASIALFIFILIVTSDCDLTLRFLEKFGRKPNVFYGQVVWIVGASSGIGESMAYQLVANGAKLVLSARRENELQKVKSQCLVIGKKTGITEADVLVLPVDVSKMDKHQDYFNQVISHFGQLDVLINNAGRSQLAYWLDIDMAVDKDLFEGNVFGLLNLSRVVIPHFLAKKRGHIAITSSICGKIGAPFSATYNATKHALHGYFETARAEFGPQGISVTLLCPGPVFSDILGACVTGEFGQALGGSFNPNDRRMSTDRCAYLSVVAIANRLDEVWLALNPVLLTYYASQYCPSIFRSFFGRFGARQAMRFRDRRGELIKARAKPQE